MKASSHGFFSPCKRKSFQLERKRENRERERFTVNTSRRLTYYVGGPFVVRGRAVQLPRDKQKILARHLSKLVLLETTAEII